MYAFPESRNGGSVYTYNYIYTFIYAHMEA